MNFDRQRWPRPRAQSFGSELEQFECIALLLQGGGALGAYQAGVYEALAEAGIQPNWLAGISIGAINCALIAGNPVESRVEKLREFWELVTANPLLGSLMPPAKNSVVRNEYFSAVEGDFSRGLASLAGANAAMLWGASGFFCPRAVFPWFFPLGSQSASSFYDTSPLRATLEKLIDFDRINAGSDVRLSVGAVNVRSGNFDYFDTSSHVIRPEHIMASGALPPGFPAIEIDGEHYWDGGLVSNTPLQWVAESLPRKNTLAFQVDLWNARGELPGNIAQVETRRKEIQYSSRTRAGTDGFKHAQRSRNAVASLIENLPDELKNTKEATLLRNAVDRKVYNIIHLIYRPRRHEGHSKDYEFTRSSMEAHWRAGYDDTCRTLRHPHVLSPPPRTTTAS